MGDGGCVVIQLLHGDCLELLPTLPKVDAVITDPPYGLGKRMKGGSWGATSPDLMQWDSAARADFVRPLLEIAPIVVIWGGNYYELPPSRGWLSWYKPDAPPTMGHFELAWTNVDRTAQQMRYSIAATNAERVGHPTQKPVALMKWCMEKVGVPVGATVLDPFMGSGSTGVACAKTGRSFIGIELDADYFAMAQRRIAEAQMQPALFTEAA